MSAAPAQQAQHSTAQHVKLCAGLLSILLHTDALSRAAHALPPYYSLFAPFFLPALYTRQPFFTRSLSSHAAFLHTQPH